MSRFGAVSSRYVIAWMICLIQSAALLTTNTILHPAPVSFHRRWADSDDEEAENEGGSMNGAEEVSTYEKNNAPPTTTCPPPF